MFPALQGVGRGEGGRRQRGGGGGERRGGEGRKGRKQEILLLLISFMNGEHSAFILHQSLYTTSPGSNRNPAMRSGRQRVPACLPCPLLLGDEMELLFVFAILGINPTPHRYQARPLALDCILGPNPRLCLTVFQFALLCCDKTLIRANLKGKGGLLLFYSLLSIMEGS